MAWGKKLLLSLSVFANMLLKRLPDGSEMKKWLPGQGSYGHEKPGKVMEF